MNQNFYIKGNNCNIVIFNVEIKNDLKEVPKSKSIQKQPFIERIRKFLNEIGKFIVWLIKVLPFIYLC